MTGPPGRVTIPLTGGSEDASFRGMSSRRIGNPSPRLVFAGAYAALVVVGILQVLAASAAGGGRVDLHVYLPIEGIQLPLAIGAYLGVMALAARFVAIERLGFARHLAFL